MSGDVSAGPPPDRAAPVRARRRPKLIFGYALPRLIVAALLSIGVTTLVSPLRAAPAAAAPLPDSEVAVPLPPGLGPLVRKASDFAERTRSALALPPGV